MNIKPCPFCGTDDVLTQGSMFAYVRCQKCGTCGSMVSPKNEDASESDMREAERLWNDRKCGCGT